MSADTLGNISSGLSAVLARGPSSAIQQWTCPCLNIRLSLAPGSTSSSAGTSWLAELASENAIHVQLPSLTSREIVSLAENNSIACAKCLNCDTVVYATSKPAPPEPARALGFNTSVANTASASNDSARETGRNSSPSRSRLVQSPFRDLPGRAARSSEPLVRPLDRKIWILPNVLSPDQASNVVGSDAFSPAFNVLVHRTNAAPRQAKTEDSPRNAANVPVDSIRDATPTRPAAAAGDRRSSYVSNAGSISSVLPAVPQHLISSPPTSPRVGGPNSSAPSTPDATTSTAPAPGTPGATGSSSNPVFAANPFAAQLDSVAVERLKDMRAKAEAEVFELVRQKKREMEQLEKRLREEAESLLSASKTHRHIQSTSSNGSTASLIEKALKGQQHQRHPSEPAAQPRGRSGGVSQATAPTPTPVAAGGGARSTGSAVPREISTAQSSVTSDGRRYSLQDEYSDLPPSAFERRPTHASTNNSSNNYSNGAAPAAVASSLGGLSASFAMRGRDLPTQMQDWAEKRRLRERYPQGDHSALPSAANSTANSTANSAANSIADSEEDAWLAHGGTRVQERRRTRESSTNTEEEAEMDRRGRGRQPSRQREASSSREPRQPQPQPQPQTSDNADDKSSEVRDETVRRRAGRSTAGTFNPPTLMSSSLLAKRPALAYVDDGRDDDENTPSVGGKLISPQTVAEPSAKVTLRPRDPPPSNTEPLKPATRSIPSGEDVRGGAIPSDAAAATSGRASNSPKSRKTAEKKVAFAETEDRVDHTVASDEYDDDGDEEEPGTKSSLQVIPSIPLVDEAADAVFEIDEETEGAEADEDAGDEAMQASPEDHDRHKVQMSQSGLRTGASGRLRGQGDDTLPGFEDDATEPAGRREGSSGSLSDDFRSSSSDDEDAVPPGFGAASFSALAASQSAMHTLASSMARAGLDDESFDPASLRMDGRVRAPLPSTSDRDLAVEPEPFVVGSLRNAPRRMSVQLQPSQAAEGPDVPVAGSVTGSSKHQRSSSRNRISSMSKEDADTEVRLSGLLAPNAPSHRSLWSPKEAKARRAGKHKYKLNDEDNQKWDLWKRKVGSGDAGGSDKMPPKDEESKDGVRSTPMAVAPPSQYIAASSGIGPRPLREGTMIDPDTNSSANAFSVFDRHVAARTAAPAAAEGLAIGKRTWGYGSFKDDTSGFEVEPKTSLPYKEKMMVPSLRKALRKSIFEPEPSTKLATIPDAEDTAASVSAGKSATSAAALGQPVVVTGISSASPAPKGADMKGALPGSVITKGFHMPGANDSATPGNETPKAAISAATTASVTPLATGLGLGAISTSSKSSVTPSNEPIMRDAAVGLSQPGSGTATPTSLGRRSPRPPYVAPPPPTSASTVLESDPAQAPRPLRMFQVPADTSFRLHEEGEEPETEEGWAKVLKFMHVVEQLKLNKRTGWMHHRVPKPESIADHMYRMAILSLLCPEESDVDLGKCVQLAVVHDLAEAEVGDLTPLDGVNKHEKMRREKEAIQYFVHDLLGSSSAGLRIEALWEEYEARETRESKLVKDLDRFELGLQAVEYERRWGIDDLQAFWEGSVPHIGHPRIRRWAEELVKEREQLWKERGKEYVQELPR